MTPTSCQLLAPARLAPWAHPLREPCLGFSAATQWLRHFAEFSKMRFSLARSGRTGLDTGVQADTFSQECRSTRPEVKKAMNATEQKFGGGARTRGLTLVSARFSSNRLRFVVFAI